MPGRPVYSAPIGKRDLEERQAMWRPVWSAPVGERDVEERDLEARQGVRASLTLLSSADARRSPGLLGARRRLGDSSCR